MQSQAMQIPRELWSLNEEVGISLDGLYLSSKFLATSISHGMHCRAEIPKDATGKKNLMKAADEVLQIYYTHNTMIMIVFRPKLKNRIRPPPTERNRTQDTPDDF